MYFKDFESFINMGGHGFYVWLCYSIVFVGLVGYFVFSKKQSQNSIRSLELFYKRMNMQQQKAASKDSAEEL